MNYYNVIEERLAQQYLTLGVGTNKICTDCHQDSNLSMPIGCWCVGSNFNNHQKRILFVGKNARGNPGAIENNFRNTFQYARDKLWNKRWAYWSYTRAISQKIFKNDSIENIAFTNIVKCNSSGGVDTTSDSIKNNCILKLKVLQNELQIINPTHIIYYTSYFYDNYIPNVFNSFTINYNGIRSIGKRTMPWQEAIATLGKQTFYVLRVGHPQYKEKSSFVDEISNWIENT